MRITRLKLVNFIGIKNGTGKNEIELFFPKNDNIITMFNGKNGSGKSTIMSQLTPYKDSFDDRKSLILSGKEGVKEIDIEHNGHTYKIKHIYGAKAASFIQEDGVELNENGGVRTFEDQVKLKFGLDKEYFKVGKIGSNTENFIQFTTTQRKTYISTFVESVQKYLDAYKIVAEKAKLNDKQIEQISSDLAKLDDINTIHHKLKENDKQLKEIEKNITDSTNESIRLDVEIEALNKILDGINYLEVKATVETKDALLKKNHQINEIFKTKYPNLSLEECNKFIEEQTKVLDGYKATKTQLDGQLTSATTDGVNIDNEITKATTQLEGKTVINLDELLGEITTLRSTKASLETFFTNNILYKAMRKDEAKMPVFLDNFKTFMTTMLSYYTLLNDRTIDPSKRNVELFFQNDFSTVFGEYSKTVNTTIANNRELLETKNAEYNTNAANLDKLEILEKRPHECHIDACPFIADALKYVDLPQKLADIEKAIEGLKNTISLNEEKSDKLGDIRIAYSNIAKAFKTLNHRENLIYQYFVSKFGKITLFMTAPLNDLRQHYNDVVAEAEGMLTKINEYNETVSSLNLKELQYNKSAESEKTRLYFENELVELNKKKNESTSKINDITSQISTLANEITSLETEITEYKDYATSLTETDSLEKEVEELNKTISTYETNSKLKTEKVNRKTELTGIIAQANIDKTNVSNAITTLKAHEITINSLKENMDNLKKSFAKTDLLKRALSPKSGIPLIFIQSYLDGTEAIANELLNIAYGGKFEIKFLPTESDFFIQVRTGTNIVEDIKLASQGEISLTTISISLALIERSLGEYNIMYLDEIDGPLDRDNRESFINIINKQIEKLNLEQIFVISHNNAFDNCAMNLILLDGNTVDKDDDVFMKNKQIIYDVATAQ